MEIVTLIAGRKVRSLFEK